MRTRLKLLIAGLLVAGSLAAVGARQQAGADAAQAEASRVAVDADDIGGVVTSPSGPEAGVWVIAETTDLPTKFRRIVVTDDRGRYLIPDLPRANYKVWGAPNCRLLATSDTDPDGRQDDDARNSH